MGKGHLYLFAILLMAIYANALGISYQYMENNSLELYPGQEYHFKLVIQNKDPESAVANISEDSPIVQIIGDPILRVPAQNFDTYVVFNISVPTDARIGDNYVINYAVAPIQEGEGQVPLSIRYSRDFNVHIVDAPDADLSPEVQLPTTTTSFKDNFFMPLLLLIAIVAIVSVLVWRKSSQLGRKIAPEMAPMQAHKENNHIEVAHHDEPASIEAPPMKVETTIVHNMPMVSQTRMLAEEKMQPEILPVVIPKAMPESKWNFTPRKEIPKPTSKSIILTDTSKYFYAKNGAALKSLAELRNALSSMDEDTFSHHVNSNKNDFANWTLHCLEEPEIASAMLKSNTRMEMLKATQNEA